MGWCDFENACTKGNSQNVPSGTVPVHYKFADFLGFVVSERIQVVLIRSSIGKKLHEM
jgi:hypothetical protein